MMTSEHQFKQHRSPHYRGRFAPSPTGPLHVGSLVAAFGSFLHARAAGGEWLVRIEDIDTPRTVPGAAEQQLEALRRFGLEWDGDVVWQSRRQALYRDALATLQRGGTLFACHCSRAELDGRLHHGCVSQHRDGPFALRVRAPDEWIGFTDALRGPQRQNLAREVGDFVVRRADGLVAYQLAVVVDDADQGITDVVRGADLIDSTARQIHLQCLLGLPTPSYAHLPLALDAQGHKLGKSQQALALDAGQPLPALRAAWAFLGQAPDALAGCSTLAVTIDHAIRHFRLEQVPRQDRRLDAPEGGENPVTPSPAA